MGWWLPAGRRRLLCLLIDMWLGFGVFDLVFVVGVAAGLALVFVGAGAWRRAVYVYRLRGRSPRFCVCFLTLFLRGFEGGCGVCGGAGA